MILEQVQSHPQRTELYIDKIIIPHERVSESDKKIIKRILLKEIATSPEIFS